MSSRSERRRVIKRKGLDYKGCPVDKLVLEVLHAHSTQVGNDNILAEISYETLKMIRSDVFKAHPDILDREAVDG